MTLDPQLPPLGSPDTGPAGRSARRRGHRLHRQTPTGSGAAGPLEDLLGPVASEASRDAACWERGAAGEELTARLLAPLTHLGWTVLHDRRVPGSSANLDHLVIGDGTVFVIDTKAWRGELKLVADGQLWYGPIPLDDVLDRLAWQTGEVALRLRRRLDRPVDVRPVLCLHGPRLPTDPLHLGGVAVVTGASLLGLLAGAVPPTAGCGSATIAAAAAEVFPIR